MGSTQQEIDRAALGSEYRRHLVRLGLLSIKYKKPKRGDLPEFDEKSGSMKATGYELTALGRLLLRQIDILKDGEL